MPSIKNVLSSTYTYMSHSMKIRKTHGICKYLNTENLCIKKKKTTNLLKQMRLETLFAQQSLFPLTIGIYVCIHTCMLCSHGETDCIRFLNQVKTSHLWTDFADLENETFRWPVLNLSPCLPASFHVNDHHIGRLRKNTSSTKQYWPPGP